MPSSKNRLYKLYQGESGSPSLLWVTLSASCNAETGLVINEYLLDHLILVILLSEAAITSVGIQTLL